ncbi:craniofacial development protein 2-like [Tachysurus ichikawai]
MTVIVTYAPTDVADTDAEDAFFDQLHWAVGLASPHDIIILTDTNATLSNNNGNRLLLFCHYNNLCVADTWFPQKLICYWTWYSPDGRTRKALDHILISRHWKSVVTNCRVYRGAELRNTDHRLLVAHLKLKLRANQHTKTLPRLDSSLLSDSNIATDFSCTIRRTFDNMAKNKVNDWQTFKESIIQSAHNVFGHFRPPPKKPGRLTSSTAEDEEKFWQAEAKHLESAANNNNMSRVFSLLHQARNGPRIKTALVKYSDGNLIATEANCLESWKELEASFFSMVPPRPIPPSHWPLMLQPLVLSAVQALSHLRKCELPWGNLTTEKLPAYVQLPQRC